MHVYAKNSEFGKRATICKDRGTMGGTAQLGGKGGHPGDN